MKRFLSVSAAGAVLVLIGGAALADPPGMMGMGMGGQMGMGQGMMHGTMMHGMMHGVGAGPGNCPGMAATTGTQAAVTEDKAKDLAQEYADQHLPGYKVEKVLPYTGRNNMTMYSVELKGPKDEVRVFHVNPFGRVMPFGGPWRRGA